MVAAFWHPQTAAGARREPFPITPPPPPGIVRVRRRVEWRDIDPAQHVNNANYLAYIEECNVAAAAAYGWPLARIMAEGVGIVARRYRIEYREPAVMDDELEVTSYLADVKRATAVRHNEIRRVVDGALLARAYALWVFVDLATGKPMRVPGDFIESFRPNVAGN
jgi:acyl-CoA thioester hydrolase